MSGQIIQSKTGQHTIEYAVLIAVVAAAVVAMQTYVRRSIQANLKNGEEEVNASLQEQPGNPAQ